MRPREAAWARRRALPVLLLAALGCGGTDGPPPIALGAPCAVCGMEVRDAGFACERSVDGRWRVYDAIECLMRDPAGGSEGAWLADYDSHRLRPADSIWVVQGAFASPMGGGLAAFDRRATADSIAAATRGRVARLATLFAEAPRGDR